MMLMRTFCTYIYCVLCMYSLVWYGYWISSSWREGAARRLWLDRSTIFGGSDRIRKFSDYTLSDSVRQPVQVDHFEQVKIVIKDRQKREEEIECEHHRQRERVQREKEIAEVRARRESAKKPSKAGNYWFYKEDGLLYHHWHPQEEGEEFSIEQLIISKQREAVLRENQSNKSCKHSTSRRIES